MEIKGIGYLIKNINDKIKVRADAELKSHRLTLAQSRVLGFLTFKGGQATQKEIEAHLEVSHPTVVGIVARMEQNGFLETGIDPEDKRNKIVKMTAKTRAISEDMRNMIIAQEADMTRGLTEAEVNELNRMLVVIHNNLD